MQGLVPCIRIFVLFWALVLQPGLISHSFPTYLSKIIEALNSAWEWPILKIKLKGLDFLLCFFFLYRMYNVIRILNFCYTCQVECHIVSTYFSFLLYCIVCNKECQMNNNIIDTFVIQLYTTIYYLPLFC